MVSPVYTAVENSTVGDVRKIFKKKKIHAMPVVELVNKLPQLSRVIKGIVTASDLNSKIKDKTIITDVMENMVHVVHKNASVKSAAKMMLKHKVHHLVVMNDGEITGMISSFDFVKLVEKHGLE